MRNHCNHSLAAWVMMAGGGAFAAALSATASTVSIVGMPGGVTQSLPVTYVEKFQRWVVNQEGRVLSRACRTVQQVEWPAHAQQDDDNDEMNGDWKIRPCLDILIKSGSPSYVMAGMQLKQNAVLGQEDAIAPLCPLARQWTSFSFVVEPNFRIETFSSQGEGQETLSLQSKTQTESVSQMKTAMELFGVLISQMDVESPIREGIHIVTIPLDWQWISLPAPSQQPYTLTCLATAEPDAKQILTMDEGLAEMTASSILEVTIAPSSSCEASL